MNTFDLVTVRDQVEAVNGLNLVDDMHVTLTLGNVAGDGLHLHPNTAEALRQTRRAIGAVTKHESVVGMSLKGNLAGLEVTIYPPAGTCEKVQVGTEMKRVTVETDEYEPVPVYEWKCDGVLS